MEPGKKGFKRKLFITSPKQENEHTEEPVPGSIVLALQSKVAALQNKYNDFISKCIENINREKPKDSSPINTNMLKSAQEVKKYCTEPVEIEDCKDYSKLLDTFLIFKNKIPKELERDFISLKEEAFKHIHLLKKRLNYSQTEMVFLKNKPHKRNTERVNSEAQTTQAYSSKNTEVFAKDPHIGSISNLSEELSMSKESIKLLSDKLSMRMVPNKAIPKLNLLDLTPTRAAAGHREHKSASRSVRNRENSERFTDSITNQSFLAEENPRIDQVIQAAMEFASNVIKSYENSFEEKEMMMKRLRQTTHEFCFNVKKIEMQTGKGSDKEQKLREELENCKKVAMMYEKKLKIKNATIYDLRQKAKSYNSQIGCLRTQVEAFLEKQEEFVDEVINRTNLQFEQIQEKFISIRGHFTTMVEKGLNEAREKLEIANKNSMIEQEVEIYRNRVEELEFSYKEVEERIISLKHENEGLRLHKLTSERMIEDLKEELSDARSQIIELEKSSDSNQILKNSIKMQEFELKQIAFEKSEL